MIGKTFKMRSIVSGRLQLISIRQLKLSCLSQVVLWQLSHQFCFKNFDLLQRYNHRATKYWLFQISRFTRGRCCKLPRLSCLLNQTFCLWSKQLHNISDLHQDQIPSLPDIDLSQWIWWTLNLQTRWEYETRRTGRFFLDLQSLILHLLERYAGTITLPRC